MAMTSTATAAREVIERFFRDHAPEWLAENVEFRDMTQPEPMRGRAAVTAFLHHFYGEAFADARAADARIVASGGLVAVDWVFRGRHTGSLLGETPTHREVAHPMAAIYEVVGGEIAAARLYYDALGLLRQLGIDMQGGSL